MKKVLLSVVILTFVLALAACGSDSAESKLVVGASNVPHAEILEKAAPILEEKGIELEIITFQDYVLPNKALAEKELDANYFQHIPYLESQIADHGYDFVNAGGIHIEPIGVYSQEYESLADLPDGAEVIMSNSVADHGRFLALLQNEGLIKVDESVNITEATIEDIVEYYRDIEFTADIEAGLLPQVYNNGEGDAVLINTNYAIDAGLNPVEDAIALEGSESPYVNIITVRNGDETREEIQTLVEVLRSEEIQSFILEEYNNSVVPVSE
ncbi:MetQ/NlpA family ABC transporter substrate-binding protein [Chengkuizengella axinellae]|uniref:Lipoprotein n=1 Tax=Chengkuizengella axinellae TaxID=3064388 RepID=A0ABT9J171_9BACL|nr:MetQ/NlpA family ABC transporter substrate-binding protein [Chengkuizengella sp. 2205SS18-9]MDP5275371.1 MetQ/NlpA family ABC transporter substrate-binding protein [Chengkuizengella sp. 2205SS18-9]